LIREDRIWHALISNAAPVVRAVSMHRRLGEKGSKMTRPSILFNTVALSVGLALGWLLFGTHFTLASKPPASTSSDVKPESAGAMTASQPAPPRVDHILLEVSNMQASLAFYHDLLGFRPKSLADHFSTLQGANVDIYLSTHPWDWKPPQGKDERLGLGMYPHFEVASVHETVVRAQGAGYKIAQEPREYDWGTEAFVSDPDGYTWALVNLKKTQ
jgi:catechol 2,3-dioxygenase-like lactoylglutathione lyase family enzyme